MPTLPWTRGHLAPVCQPAFCTPSVVFPGAASSVRIAPSLSALPLTPLPPPPARLPRRIRQFYVYMLAVKAPEFSVCIFPCQRAASSAAGLNPPGGAQVFRLWRLPPRFSLLRAGACLGAIRVSRGCIISTRGFISATGFPGPRGARRIATLARSGQQACAGTCALRHHSRHNSAPALPPPSDDVCWGQSTPASSLIAREARPLAAASDLRRRLDRRWPRWRPT